MKIVMFTIIGVFILATPVISTTGAVAVATTCKANPDTFDLSPSRPFVGNVLSNDQGTELNVVSTSKTKNGGKAIVYSKGDFYYKPAFCCKTSLKDSFTYTMVDKYGHKRIAKVTVNCKQTNKGTGTDAGTDRVV